MVTMSGSIGKSWAASQLPTRPIPATISSKQTSKPYRSRRRATRRKLHPGHLRCDHLEQPAGELLLGLVGEVMVVEVGDALRLGGGRVGDLPDAVAEAGDHRATRARIQDLVPTGRIEPDSLTPFDARVGEVEKTGEDVRLGRANPGGHREAASGLSRTMASKYRLRRRSARRRETGARRRVSSSSASGSTPSASSSCR